eukprot:2698682-Amphidinium_carterae.3
MGRYAKHQERPMSWFYVKRCATRCLSTSTVLVQVVPEPVVHLALLQPLVMAGELHALLKANSVPPEIITKLSADPWRCSSISQFANMLESLDQKSSPCFRSKTSDLQKPVRSAHWLDPVKDCQKKLRMTPSKWKLNIPLPANSWRDMDTISHPRGRPCQRSLVNSIVSLQAHSCSGQPQEVAHPASIRWS